MDITGLLNDLGPLNTIAISAIVFIGLPHGAMDGAVAYRLGWGKNLKKALVFLLAYVLLAAGVVVFWFQFPVIALIAFLGISMVHFGFGDVRSTKKFHIWIEAIAHGGVVICGISLSHVTSVDVIFSSLVDGGDTSLIWGFIYVASGISGCAFLYCLSKFSQGRQWVKCCAEMLSLGLIFYFLPPLVAFAFYFCFIHSIRHFVSLYRVINDEISSKKIYWLTFIFSVITWSAGVLVLSMYGSSVEVGSQVLNVVFIGLAALTVPHMILIDGWVKTNFTESPLSQKIF